MPFMETYQRIKKKLKKPQTWLIIAALVRDHFLTASYSLGNSALYLNAANRTLKLLNLMDKEVDEDNPLYYIFLVCTVILFVATYRSYLRSNHEFFTKELPKCHRDCTKIKAAKTSAGVIGSGFKSFASSGSLFDLATHQISDSLFMLLLVILISIGNLCANLSILNRPERRFIEGEFYEDGENSHLLAESRNGMYSTNDPDRLLDNDKTEATYRDNDNYKVVFNS